jgi:hypothetical protein
VYPSFADVSFVLQGGSTIDNVDDRRERMEVIESGNDVTPTANFSHVANAMLLVSAPPNTRMYCESLQGGTGRS